MTSTEQSKTASHTATPWRNGHWYQICRLPEHNGNHPGEPLCKYEWEFQDNDEYVCGIAGSAPGQKIVDVDYDGLVISPANAAFICQAVNAHEMLVSALREANKTLAYIASRLRAVAIPSGQPDVSRAFADIKDVIPAVYQQAEAALAHAEGNK